MTNARHSTHKSLPGYLRTYRRRAGLGALLVAANVVVGVCVPFLLRFAIDDLVGHTMTAARLFGYAGLYVVTAALSGIFGLLMRRVMLSLGYTIETHIRSDLFSHLTTLDGGFYRSMRTGDLLTRLTADLQAIREFFSQGLLQGTRTVIGFVLAFTIMFVLNAQMALVMLALLPAISLIFFYLLRVISVKYESVQEQHSVLSNFAQESFSGIRLVKGFGLEERQGGRFAEVNGEYLRRNLDLSRVERPIAPLMAFLFAFGVALLLLVGGRQVLQGSMSLGEFVQFNQYLFFLQWPMLALGWTTNVIQRGHTSWLRVRAILDAQPAIRDGDWTDPALETVEGDIVFRKVSLHLDGRHILEDMNLTIPAGATLGVTGPTGSGKTMVASLVARLVEPTLGEVRIGSRDIREYPLQTLRTHIGMAPQEPFLFSDTLAMNIALGLPDLHLDQVEWAAEVAQLRGDVDLFPHGFDTILGERGVTLSGGQRQRTAISRAVARQPAILILDDVFSAIDTQTEARIAEQLRPVARDSTTIVISHRISTLRDADFIVVLEHGRITQQGTHEQLASTPGYYRELDEMQRLEARLEAE